MLPCAYKYVAKVNNIGHVGHFNTLLIWLSDKRSFGRHFFLIVVSQILESEAGKRSAFKLFPRSAPWKGQFVRFILIKEL